MDTGEVRGRVEASASSCLFWCQALHATLAKHQPLRKVNHSNNTTSAKLAASVWDWYDEGSEASVSSCLFWSRAVYAARRAANAAAAAQHQQLDMSETC